MIKVRRRVLLLAVFVGGGVIYALLAISKATKMRDSSVYMALDCAALAALAYLDDRGALPSSIGDLIRAGYISRSGDGKYAECAVRPTATPTWEDVARVHLSFPASPADYEIRDGKLVDRVSGAEHFLLNIPGEAHDIEHLRNATQFLWRRWHERAAGTQTSK